MAARIALSLSLLLWIGSLPAAAVEVLWNDQQGIHRAAPDQTTDPPLFETFETRGMALDRAASQLYWSDVLPLGSPISGGVIYSGSAQGGDASVLVNNLASPAGVAIDPEGGRVYWTDLGDAQHPSAVYSARLDGSDVAKVIQEPWMSDIAGIALDTQRKQLYVTFINPLLDGLLTGGIARAGLDGSELQAVVGSLAQPLGVAVDPQRETLYWVDAGWAGPELDGKIEAAGLDGQNRRTLLGGLQQPFGLALDASSQYLYWTDMMAGTIQRTAASGSLPFFEDVVTQLDEPTALVVLPEPAAAWLLLLGLGGMAPGLRRRRK